MISVDSFYRRLNIGAPPTPPHYFRIAGIGAISVESEGEAGCVRFISESVRGESLVVETALRLAKGGNNFYLSLSRGGRLCAYLPCDGRQDHAERAVASLTRLVSFLQGREE